MKMALGCLVVVNAISHKSTGIFSRAVAQVKHEEEAHQRIVLAANLADLEA